MSTPHEATIAKPRWERRKEARPAELVSAALELFVEKGYAGTRLTASVNPSKWSGLVPVLTVVRPGGAVLTAADGLVVSGRSNNPTS